MATTIGCMFDSPLSGPNRAMQPRCATRFESHIPKSLAMRKRFFFASDAKTHLLSETSKRHLKRQQPQSDAKSDANFAAIVQFLTCHFTVAFRGRCTILQKSSFHGC